MPFNKECLPRIRRVLGRKRPLSRYHFAVLLGVTEKTVQNWEKGRSAPSFDCIDKLVSICIDKGIQERLYVYPANKSAEDLGLLKPLRHRTARSDNRSLSV